MSGVGLAAVEGKGQKRHGNGAEYYSHNPK
jgi:hypothetical protein